MERMRQDEADRKLRNLTVIDKDELAALRAEVEIRVKIRAANMLEIACLGAKVDELRARIKELETTNFIRDANGTLFINGAGGDASCAVDMLLTRIVKLEKVASAARDVFSDELKLRATTGRPFNFNTEREVRDLSKLADKLTALYAELDALEDGKC
jgi:hypothetical protein